MWAVIVDLFTGYFFTQQMLSKWTWSDFADGYLLYLRLRLLLINECNEKSDGVVFIHHPLMEQEV